MWRIWRALRLTPIKEYIRCSFCLYDIVCINYLFICSMPKYHFVLNEIVEIVSACPMPMDVDPSIVVLDNVSDVLLFAWS